MSRPSAIEQVKKGIDLLKAWITEETGIAGIDIKPKGSPRDFNISLEFYIGEAFIFKDKYKSDDLCSAALDEYSPQYQDLERYAEKVADIIIEKTSQQSPEA